MPYRLEQFSNFTVLPLDQDCFKMRFAAVVVFDRTILIGGLRRNGGPANVFHNAGGTITYTKRGTELVVTGSGPLTIMNSSTG